MSSIRQFFGRLCTIREEIPFDSPRDARRADAFNKAMGPLGFRIARFVKDWGVRFHSQGAPMRLESGDLITVFKTVSGGSIKWKGTLDFESGGYYRGLQKGIKPQEWLSMFNNQNPARIVTKGGSEIFGALEICITEDEGLTWAVNEFGAIGYNALYFLQDGDDITVYDAVHDGEILWKGHLNFGPEHPQKVENHEVLRETQHMPTHMWLALSEARYPVSVQNINIA